MSAHAAIDVLAEVAVHAEDLKARRKIVANQPTREGHMPNLAAMVRAVLGDVVDGKEVEFGFSTTSALTAVVVDHHSLPSLLAATPACAALLTTGRTLRAGLVVAVALLATLLAWPRLAQETERAHGGVRCTEGILALAPIDKVLDPTLGAARSPSARGSRFTSGANPNRNEVLAPALRSLRLFRLARHVNGTNSTPNIFGVVS